MIGIDLTKISRFKNAKETFLKKVLHPDEILSYYQSQNKNVFLAQRWAIKEALYKTDNNFYHFNRVKIDLDDRIFKFKGFHISTTIEDDYCIAIVLKDLNYER